MKLSVNSKKYRRRIALCASVGRFCCTPSKRKSQKGCYYRYVNRGIFLNNIYSSSCVYICHKLTYCTPYAETWKQSNRISPSVPDFQLQVWKLWFLNMHEISGPKRSGGGGSKVKRSKQMN